MWRTWWRSCHLWRRGFRLLPLLQGAWQSCHNVIRFNQKIAVETVEKEIGFLQYFPVVVVFINNENVSGRTEACGSYAKLWRSEKKLRCQSSLRPGPCKTSEYFLFLESWTTSGLPTAIETSLFGTATTWPVIFEEKNRNLWFCFCVMRDDEGNDDVLIEIRRSWGEGGDDLASDLRWEKQERSWKQIDF